MANNVKKKTVKDLLNFKADFSKEKTNINSAVIENLKEKTRSKTDDARSIAVKNSKRTREQNFNYETMVKHAYKKLNNAITPEEKLGAQNAINYWQNNAFKYRQKEFENNYNTDGYGEFKVISDVRSGSKSKVDNYLYNKYFNDRKKSLYDNEGILDKTISDFSKELEPLLKNEYVSKEEIDRLSTKSNEIKSSIKNYVDFFDMYDIHNEASDYYRSLYYGSFADIGDSISKSSQKNFNSKEDWDKAKKNSEYIGKFSTYEDIQAEKTKLLEAKYVKKMVEF